RDDRSRILEILEEGILGRSLGHDAEARQRQFLSDVLAALDRVVEELEPDRARNARRKTKSQTEDEVEEEVRLIRQRQDYRPIDDRNRRDPNSASDSDLLVPLQKRIIECPVRIHFALQDRILDAPAAKVEHVALQFAHTSRQRSLRRKGSPIVGEQAVVA